MDVFDLRNRLIADYEPYVRGFIKIRDQRVSEKVDQELRNGLLWPEPLIQLNPSFEMGESIDELVAQGVLHEGCADIFRIKRNQTDTGTPMRLYRHQSEAVRAARTGENYVLTTGTGSGKSLSYIVPIVDHVLRNGPGKGVQAIVVYPMNALANSQAGELEKFLNYGFPDGVGPISFKRYTGQESDQERQAIIAAPPDIILTNYVMLELILTRPYEKQLVEAAIGLKFLVLDELHTYRGRQGADVAMLLRRLKDRLHADDLQFVGTSATLSTAGSFDEQRKEIAAVATKIFGSGVDPENVIGETLKRATPEPDIQDMAYLSSLTARVDDRSFLPPTDFASFIQDPLAAWIEGTFGIATVSGRLVRQKPRSISGKDGAAAELSRLTGVSEEKCAEAIKECLLAGYRCSPSPETGLRPFAFRLHQFISRGDTVYMSLEENSKRYITVHGQLRVPGREGVLLFPVVFCRECGHEYYVVRKTRDESGQERFDAREFDDRESIGENGYIYYSEQDPWPLDPEEIMRNIPDQWLEEYRDNVRIKRNYQDKVPRPYRVKPDGEVSADGLNVHFVPIPFNFCLCCGVTYESRQRQDFSKLGTLGSEGRSTATTILCLSAILNLRKEESLPEKARKLLSFTDNRQDASLQSGHFNDFIETSLIRAAIYAAVRSAGDRGVAADELPFKVFDALDLPLHLYAVDPTVRDYAARDFKKVFRDVITYRIYRDLKRGWRILSPNLEQCGLLYIRYEPLDELVSDQEAWQYLHPALSLAPAETRRTVAIALLDFLRRGLAIKTGFLEQDFQERLKQQSSLRLIDPWAIDLNEKMEHASIAFPRSQSRERNDYAGNMYLSARGRVGNYLRLPTTFPHLNQPLTVSDTQTVIAQLLDALRQAGILEIVYQPADGDDVPGYQIRADAMCWVAADGTSAFHDPLRVPRKSKDSTASNPYFIRFYRYLALDAKGISAREHTAQVQADKREEREKKFREGSLKVMFCSPTMELGVDISDLNMVNLRNVPPTPANYAQRSGRAGRSGQPALVVTYCASGNAHDQYFFRRPHLMVSGAVQPPRIDLTNEDLIRSHVQAIWLAEAGIDLGRSLKDILDINGEDPSLALIQSVKDKVADERIRARARNRALGVITPIMDELQKTDWYHKNWLDQVLSLQIEREFERCCDRWRNLYTAALKQARAQDRVIRDPNRSIDDKNKAKRLRAEAESQLKLLTESSSAMQSDFYSYRYFASEGFLPGYNFPRLPLSAYIAGTNRGSSKDEYVSRPRFLAISEFGPRSLVYHEGARYEINRVILPVSADEELVTRQIKLCPACGYLHDQDDICDTCDMCGTELGSPLGQLFRLENVSTRRCDKITSDEEERRRIGYEIHTAIRFADRGAGPAFTHAGIESAEGPFAELRYGQAATIWRINYGWRQRAQGETGFLLDLERGYWAKRPDDDETDDALSRRTARVIPFVEDRKNTLILSLKPPYTPQVMASLQAALKNAIQVCYQLEDNELAAEPLPDAKDRRHILFYEAAEGGAGVLRHLAGDPKALATVARTALEICHFDPDTGEDRHRAPGTTEDCVAACYNCLLSYSNQLEHQSLNRHAIRDFLLKLRTARVTSSPVEQPRDTHLQQLYRQCGSVLEKRWVEFVDRGGYRLPNRAQVLIEECGTRPDFVYDLPYKAAIYVDGPPHDYQERQERDRMQIDALEDRGYIVIRFHHEADWEKIMRQYPNIFGGIR